MITISGIGKAPKPSIRGITESRHYFVILMMSLTSDTVRRNSLPDSIGETEEGTQFLFLSERERNENYFYT